MRLIDLFPISFFRWCDSSALGNWVRSGYPSKFGIIESIHLMVLTVLVGSIIAVDLQVLGLGTRRSTAKVVREFAPWTWTALGLMVLTGFFLFMSEALRAGRSGAFFLKILLLLSAITIQALIYRGVARSATERTPVLHKVGACLSLICWLGVVFSGRAIAFGQLLPFLRGGR
jgi:hypothetical protein